MEEKGKTMKKRTTAVLLAGAALLLFAGCGGREKAKNAAEPLHYQDGSYTAEAIPEEIGGVIRLHITVAGGAITKVQMENLDRDGNEKGEDYGKASEGATNPGLYKIAQASVAGTAQLPQMLIDAQNPAGIDAVSGATLSRDAFVRAAEEALKDAKK